VEQEKVTAVPLTLSNWPATKVLFGVAPVLLGAVLNIKKELPGVTCVERVTVTAVAGPVITAVPGWTNWIMAACKREDGAKPKRPVRKTRNNEVLKAFMGIQVLRIEESLPCDSQTNIKFNGSFC
jgi:hypothetical protein